MRGFSNCVRKGELSKNCGEIHCMCLYLSSRLQNENVWKMLSGSDARFSQKTTPGRLLLIHKCTSFWKQRDGLPPMERLNPGDLWCLPLRAAFG
mmetsp:Transcript_82144/g.196971  ORF Transcript_82144/g.196971 Transcript_82144/m.196971 type:complete len:94 (+) Transcript_82144:166-447(+)